MSVRVSSVNYSGQTCTVRLYAATGNTIPYTNATEIVLGTRTMPFTYSSTTVSNEYGVFSCLFSGASCVASQLTPSDGDGNRYRTIKIGNQIWMSENLRTKRYNNGFSLYNTEELSDLNWSFLCSTYNNPCWANPWYTLEPRETYGLLYNQHAVNGGNLCPTGWHIPSSSEFSTLNTFLGVNAGTQMKATIEWASFGVGTNTSGFNSLPAGYRRHDSGTLGGEYDFGFFWSSSSDTYWYNASFSSGFIRQQFGSPGVGASVRCVKD